MLSLIDNRVWYVLPRVMQLVAFISLVVTSIVCETFD